MGKVLENKPSNISRMNHTTWQHVSEPRSLSVCSELQLSAYACCQPTQHCGKAARRRTDDARNSSKALVDGGDIGCHDHRFRPSVFFSRMANSSL